MRGTAALPITAAKAALGVRAFMNAALGVRFLAGAFFFAATFLAGAFLAAFLWSVKNGQMDDDYTPSIRMLFDDEINTTKK